MRSGRTPSGWLAVGVMLVAITAISGMAGGGTVGAGDASSVVTQLDLVSPQPGSEAFGETVLVLENGNYVVVDSRWDDGAVTNVGAVYLYDGSTNTVISTLTGSTAGDRIGSNGVYELPTGDFVVASPQWTHMSATDAGAATWVDGDIGLDGTVSAANSVHGTQIGDFVSAGEIFSLSDGDYVVSSPFWANAGIISAGAATWADSSGSTTGAVTTSNSIHGTQANDEISFPGVAALTNGNYVVSSRNWDNGAMFNAGAATWAAGDGSSTGAVSTVNSIYGSSSFGFVADGGVVALTNGHYVVSSPNWDDGAISEVGAATWADGEGATTGAVTTSNSIHGTEPNDGIGDGGVIALANGHYVISSPFWMNGGIRRGAATWASGSGATAGPVTTANSLHGSTDEDAVSGDGVIALANGNYVVGSHGWDAGAVINVGAATIGDGDGSTTGPVSIANSLNGVAAEDNVSLGGLTALTNNHYVVSSPLHDGPTVWTGAATWGDGDGPTAEQVTTSNSVHGTTFYDRVAFGGAIALTDGGYVISSRFWNNDTAVAVGAATWSDGEGPDSRSVSATNSRHGSTADDFEDSSVVALQNGHYVVVLPKWDDGGNVDAGAVSFGLADGTSTGPVAASNSVIGTAPGEILPPGPAVTNDDTVVVPTTQNRVLLMQLDLAPVFSTTPADVSATAPAGASTATVTFSLPVATDLRDAAAPAVVCVPASGSSFPIGDTAVSCSATDSSGSTVDTSFTVTVTATATPPEAAVSPLAPERFVDTRNAGVTLDAQFEADGKRGADTEYRVQIAGRGDVPADAQAVIANITAVNAEGTGFVTAHPCVTPRPLSSSLNYTAGVNLGNEVIVPLSASGELCLYTFASINLTVDITGYVDADSPTTPTTPARFLDTRPAGTSFDGVNQAGGRRSAMSTLTVTVAGRGDIPADAAAVIVNITAIGASSTGYVTAHACLSTTPNAASLNYVAGVNRGNELIVELDSDGDLCLFTFADLHLTADISGYLPAGSNLTSIAPSRFLDTRPTGVTVDTGDQAAGKQPAGTQTRLQITGRPGVPADATAVELNITAVQPELLGFITIHPCQATRPNTSSLNYVPFVNGGNDIVATLDSAGGICIYTSATTHLTVDVTAHVTPA